MQVTLTFNTEDGAELSAKDIKILRAVTGDAGDLKEAAAEAAEDKPTTTRRRTAKKAAAPEPEPETKDDDGPKLEDAVALATELVADGKTAEVKKVLAKIGVKRVSELGGDDIATFLDSFAGDDDSPI